MLVGAGVVAGGAVVCVVLVTMAVVVGTDGVDAGGGVVVVGGGAGVEDDGGGGGGDDAGGDEERDGGGELLVGCEGVDGVVLGKDVELGGLLLLGVLPGVWELLPSPEALPVPPVAACLTTIALRASKA